MERAITSVQKATELRIEILVRWGQEEIVFVFLRLPGRQKVIPGSAHKRSGEITMLGDELLGVARAAAQRVADLSAHARPYEAALFGGGRSWGAQGRCAHASCGHAQASWMVTPLARPPRALCSDHAGRSHG